MACTSNLNGARVQLAVLAEEQSPRGVIAQLLAADSAEQPPSVGDVANNNTRVERFAQPGVLHVIGATGGVISKYSASQRR